MPMTVKQSVFPGSASVILCGAFLCLAICLGFAAEASESDSTLREMRAQRRTAMRQASLAADKSGASALFGLLVIPVDFADARLPADWNSENLSRRLNEGSGGAQGGSNVSQALSGSKRLWSNLLRRPNPNPSGDNS